MVNYLQVIASKKQIICHWHICIFKSSKHAAYMHPGVKKAKM